MGFAAGHDYPEPETPSERAKKGGKKGGRASENLGSSVSEEPIFSRALLSQAREVLRLAKQYDAMKIVGR